jgi:HEAT repeat protein
VEDSRTLEPLTAALGDADPWVRYFAARALGEHRREVVLSDLTRLAFDDPAGQVRVAAVNALGRLATRAAVPALDALAACDDPDRAVAAIHALGGIRHADAWPPLQSALRAEGEAHRAAAAHAVARFGGPQAIEVLEWTAATDPSPAVVDAALEGLAAIAISSDDSESAVRVLVGLAADPARRDRVVSTLGGLPAPLIDAIARGLGDARVAVRVAVVRALSRLRQPDASRRLQSALDDASAEVRVAALTELRHLGTRGIERRVAALARSDADPAVRRAALSALKGAALLDGGAAGESTASAER